MNSRKVLVAGSTGYLGKYLIRELKKQEYWVRALTRDAARLDELRGQIDDLYIGEVTDPATLKGVCEDVDCVISAVGITRQKDGLTYMDVDYQGNVNLLEQALEKGVNRFIYVSVFNANKMMDLKIIQAKELFVDRLKVSGIDYSIIRPTGFFSDMLEFLKMAKKGRVSLFGTGEYMINPIHGQDLAEVCIKAIEDPSAEIEVGGPETFTHRQIAQLAFDVLNKKVKISTMPLWIVNIIIRFMRLTMPVKTYGPVEFLMTALTMDGVAPDYGEHNLRDFFWENRDRV
jgi:uncharacterized protein YbjT (DUF2867 family)